MNRSKITTVFFDAAGTLFHLREPVGSGYARVGRLFGLDLEPAVAALALQEIWRGMPPPYPSQSAEPERDWWRSLVERVVEECGQTMPAGYFDALWDHYAQPDSWVLLHVGDESQADWEGAAVAGLVVFELQRPTVTLKSTLSIV